MKRVLLAAVLAFSLNVSAQIEEIKRPERTSIGEVKSIGVFVYELKYNKLDSETNLYTIVYRNAYFRTLIDIKSISFEGTENDLNNLYNIFEDLLLNAEDKSSKEFKIGNNNVLIIKSKTFSTRYLLVSLGQYNEFYVTLPQLKKLFNKQ